jgi:hypothetical protein
LRSKSVAQANMNRLASRIPYCHAR